MRIQLSEHFTYKKLIRFVLPSIVMMIFTSIYSVVDGLFVSNFVGKISFAAVNLIMPFIMILGALGFMIGTGGSAIAAMTLGQGRKEKAQEYFSMCVYFTLIGGTIISITGFAAMPWIASALGARGEMLEQCVLYGRISMLTLMLFMLQNVFQSFLVTAEKSQMGLKITVCAGLTNMVLDYVFIAIFHMGIAGAALATAASEVVGGLTPLLYFARPNSSLLRLRKTRIIPEIIGKACINGSSELMTNISMSLVSMLYNFQLMRIAGADGVAAYGVIMYVNFVFSAIFIGYSIGAAPIVGYHYGASNIDELQNMFRKSLKLIGISGVVLFVVSEFASAPLTKIFVGYDQALWELTCGGFRRYALAFLLSGFNIFGSAFFTALGNGVISAAISFLRTLLFQICMLLILPLIFGVNGIWMAISAAEGLALIVTVAFFVTKNKKYHYIKERKTGERKKVKTE